MPNPPNRTNPHDLVTGHNPARSIDLLLVNAPLRDYAERPRVNDFTLPVLGMGYIATYAAHLGFNVGVLDGEALGLPVTEVIQTANAVTPRWAGFNLLAPTYEISANIAAALDPGIKILLGGHQAKAMPVEILTDPRMARCEALVIGEGETRVAELLGDRRTRGDLPGVMWLDPVLKTPVTGGVPGQNHHLAPDINAMPFVDRRYLAQDPHHDTGRWEANMVGARGCPYDCSFCGAAVSANPDVTIRVRSAENVVAEMEEGEPAPHGAAREAEEEVGVDTDPHALSLAAVVHHRQHPGLARIGMFFLARQWSGEPVVAEPDKAGKLVWADPRVLPSNTIAYPAEGIRTWMRGDRLALHGWPPP